LGGLVLRCRHPMRLLRPFTRRRHSDGHRDTTLRNDSIVTCCSTATIPRQAVPQQQQQQRWQRCGIVVVGSRDIGALSTHLPVVFTRQLRRTDANRRLRCRLDPSTSLVVHSSRSNECSFYLCCLAGTKLIS